MQKTLIERIGIKKHNPKDKIYSIEPYAQELYDAYCGVETCVKDIYTGQRLQAHDLRVMRNGDMEILTNVGISLFLDIRKERKYFEAFGIQDYSIEKFKDLSDNGYFRNLFNTRNESVIVEGNKGNYRGSLYESHIINVRDEFMKQVKDQTVAYVAKVISKNHGGFFIKVQGVDAFLPGSLAAANKIVNFETLIGKEINVMVEDYLRSSDTFIFSYKKYLEKVLPSKLEEIKRNSKLTGTITGTSKYGVFVEFEEIFTGLLHVTEMKPETVDKFNARLYRAGEPITLWVKDIKDEKLILTENDPADKISEMETFRVGVEGTVRSLKAISVKPFGAFFEIDDKIGLLSVKEMKKLHSKVEVGENYNLCISKVDSESGKIYLTALYEKTAQFV